MSYSELFSILNETESTNNYAMGRITDRLASHGEAWMAWHQTAGKGQRGKSWIDKPGESLLLSVIIKPPKPFKQYPFLFSMALAYTTATFLNNLIHKEVKLKWPNDLYIADNKAGGMLIENSYAGSDWQWAVAGFGINILQSSFESGLPNPVSLAMASDKKFDVEEVGRQLHGQLMNIVDEFKESDEGELVKNYNHILYKKNQSVKVRQNNKAFYTTVEHVDKNGILHTHDVMARSFAHGEIEWVLE